MEISLIAAVSTNGVIGNGGDIPWKAKGEQLIFKAMTYNKWCVVGRKTFESMGKLPHRNFVVISRQEHESNDPSVQYFKTIGAALEFLQSVTDHVFVCGGGQIYEAFIDMATTLHLSVVHQEVEGDTKFPNRLRDFDLMFEEQFFSNVNYTYQLHVRK